MLFRPAPHEHGAEARDEAWAEYAATVYAAAVDRREREAVPVKAPGAAGLAGRAACPAKAHAHP